MSSVEASLHICLVFYFVTLSWTVCQIKQLRGCRMRTCLQHGQIKISHCECVNSLPLKHLEGFSSIDFFNTEEIPQI